MSSSPSSHSNTLMLPLPTPAVPPPRVRGGDVLYLDFDGVLHHHDVLVHRTRGAVFGETARSGGGPPVLFEHARMLDELLQPFPRVQIVLSTSWAVPNFRRARRRLPPGLACRCIGSTFHSKMDRQSFEGAYRGMQIWADVQRREPRAWLALDDAGFGWPAWCRDHLILIRGELGDHREVIASRFAQEFEA
jgi:hypothetical protein